MFDQSHMFPNGWDGDVSQKVFLSLSTTPPQRGVCEGQIPQTLVIYWLRPISKQERSLMLKLEVD